MRGTSVTAERPQLPFGTSWSGMRVRLCTLFVGWADLLAGQPVAERAAALCVLYLLVRFGLNRHRGPRSLLDKASSRCPNADQFSRLRVQPGTQREPAMSTSVTAVIEH